MTDRLISAPQPSVLLLVGTFAAVPYVHLHLESRRRFYPEVPMIVHDDASPVAADLEDLCTSYGVDFVCTPRRYSHQPGDTHAVLSGIRAAADRGLDLAVKMSRRFLPLTDWVPQLQHIARETQYATYTNRDDGHGLGFRSECVAFHAPTWLSRPEYAQQMEHVVEVGTWDYGSVEAFLHILAREVHRRTQCEVNRAYERLFPREPGTNAYGVWPWIGTDRKRRQPSLIWRHADEPMDYYRISLAYSLPYRYEDFIDPNLGLGLGEG